MHVPLPGVHREHDVALGAALYVFVGHSAHAVPAMTPLKRPAAQEEQVVAPAALTEPAGHGLQAPPVEEL